MSEWLDLMLEEIARKEHEQEEAVEEQQRRDGAGSDADATGP